MRPWNLAEVNYGYTRDHRYDVAVLPFGATEPHNLHLPYGTDTFQVDVLADQACERAFAAGARVVRLPSIPFGTETNLREFPLALNLQPSTLGTIITDLVRSLEQCSVWKLVLVNGHGGNDFKPLLRELYGQTRVQLFLCEWYRGLTADVQREIFERAGDHAGEMETALGLAFFPQWVARDPQTGQLQADAGELRPARFEALNQGWISITRPWHLLTTNTGAGNPFPATAEKGRQLMAVAVDRLSQFLVELAQSPLDNTFPY